MQLKIVRSFILVGLAVIGWASLSYANSIVTVPSGLTPGEQYRLVFVTNETTTATSTNIADYNTFVNDVANAIGPYSSDGSLLASLGLTWTAMVSTEAEAAITNIGVDGVPVFNLEGQLVACSDGTAAPCGLWSDNSLQNPIFYDESGGLPPIGVAWTGTNPDGTSAAGTGLALGETNSEYGIWETAAAPTWSSHGFELSTGSLPVYGISGVLTYEPAPAATPEPGTISLMMLGGMFLVGKVRSKRAQAAGTTSGYAAQR